MISARYLVKPLRTIRHRIYRALFTKAMPLPEEFPSGESYMSQHETIFWLSVPIPVALWGISGRLIGRWIAFKCRHFGHDIRVQLVDFSDDPVRNLLSYCRRCESDTVHETIPALRDFVNALPAEKTALLQRRGGVNPVEFGRLLASLRA